MISSAYKAGLPGKSSLYALGSGMLSLPPWGWAVLTLALGAVFVLAMKYSRQIEDRLFALVSRLSRRREK